MKSMCQEARRNSPSVADLRPTCSCLATTSRIASSSIPRSSSASIAPVLKSSRAFRSCGGRSRLPTWSARYGGLVRDAMGSLLAQGVRGHLYPGARASDGGDRQQVGDHDVLVAEAEVVGVRQLLDALDLPLALREQVVEVEERVV